MIAFTLSLLLAFALSYLPSTFAAIGPITTLDVRNKYIAPDGFNRSTVLVNGVFPGPLITGKKGDNFKIKVTDELTDNTMERSTSIHWHGLFQSGSNYNDGVGMVTQCPLVPGSEYDYNFQVPNQAGTFWYHSHVATQYCDGLRGPMVVYDPQDPHASLYDVDDETTVITIADWYHNVSSQVMIPSIADSTLINGNGRYQGGPLTPLSVITVQPGKRYRFRLLAMSCDPFFTFSIDGHDLTIIEADGENTLPLVANNITIFAGQRYSFILTANQKVDNYWIRAEPRPGVDGGIAGFAGGINSAILRYEGSPDTDPSSSPSNLIPLSEKDLRPLENPSAPGEPHIDGADVSINLDMNFNPETVTFTINNSTWVPPAVPVLLQILSGKTAAQDLLPSGNVFTLPPNKVIQISMPPGGAIGNPHPFHLHGHSFSVVRTAGSSDYNWINPVRRDVVSLGDTTDNVTVRFVTDNAGPWFLHCHIDFHLAAGLAIVFAEDTNGTAQHNAVTSEWQQLCPSYNTFLSNKD